MQQPDQVVAVTFRDIVTGLKDLGLPYGDNVLVHRALSSLGYVEGAQTR